MFFTLFLSMRVAMSRLDASFTVSSNNWSRESLDSPFVSSLFCCRKSCMMKYFTWLLGKNVCIEHFSHCDPFDATHSWFFVQCSSIDPTVVHNLSQITICPSFFSILWLHFQLLWISNSGIGGLYRYGLTTFSVDTAWRPSAYWRIFALSLSFINQCIEVKWFLIPWDIQYLHLI